MRVLKPSVCLDVSVRSERRVLTGASLPPVLGRCSQCLMVQGGLCREQTRLLAWDCIWQQLSCPFDSIVRSEFKPEAPSWHQV